MEPNELINITTHIVKGSVWESKTGQEIITKQLEEADKIWIEKVGLSLALFKPDVIEGPKVRFGLRGVDPAVATDFAKKLQAGAQNIVVVFLNPSVGVSRADTPPSLVKADTPVIFVGKQVFDNPDLSHNLDLAHELARVFFRDQTIGKPGNILAQDKALGNQVTKEQIEKARQYPNNK